MRPSKRGSGSNSESGNAFFIVMVGIVLFAALMFTFSRGARQGADQLSGRQASVTASDILSYAQIMERSVNRALSKARSENRLSFENDFVSGYDNPDCPGVGNPCRVFAKTGGGASWMASDEFANEGAPWFFSGHNTILGVGTAAPDLVMLLPGLNTAACQALNDALNISPTPTDADGIERTTKFKGTFGSSGQIGGVAVTGVFSACVQDTDEGDYFFYHVLLAR